MLYTCNIFVSKIIVTKTVLFRVENVFQFTFELDPLSGVHIAFEDGILHTDSPILTCFGNSTQTFSAFRINR